MDTYEFAIIDKNIYETCRRTRDYVSVYMQDHRITVKKARDDFYIKRYEHLDKIKNAFNVESKCRALTNLCIEMFKCIDEDSRAFFLKCVDISVYTEIDKLDKLIENTYDVNFYRNIIYFCYQQLALYTLHLHYAMNIVMYKAKDLSVRKGFWDEDKDKFQYFHGTTIENYNCKRGIIADLNKTFIFEDNPFYRGPALILDESYNVKDIIILWDKHYNNYLKTSIRECFGGRPFRIYDPDLERYYNCNSKNYLNESELKILVRRAKRLYKNFYKKFPELLQENINLLGAVCLDLTKENVAMFMVGFHALLNIIDDTDVENMSRMEVKLPMFVYENLISKIGDKHPSTFSREFRIMLADYTFSMIYTLVKDDKTSEFVNSGFDILVDRVIHRQDLTDDDIDKITKEFTNGKGNLQAAV